MQALNESRLVHVILPSDPDDKSKVGLWWHIEVALFPGLTSKADSITFFYTVLLDVLLSTLEDLLSLFTVFLEE